MVCINNIWRYIIWFALPVVWCGAEYCKFILQLPKRNIHLYFSYFLVVYWGGWHQKKPNSNIQYTSPLRLDRREQRFNHPNFLHKLSITDLVLIASEYSIPSRKTDGRCRKSDDELTRDVWERIRAGRATSCELTMRDLPIDCLKELAISHGIFINIGRNKTNLKLKINPF